MNIKKIIIQEKNGTNLLLEAKQIRSLLMEDKKGFILQFESKLVDDDYRRMLQNELSNYLVFNVRWKPEIWIIPSIETELLREKSDEILKAAKAFRNDGISLMKRLGQVYGKDPFTKNGLNEIIRSSRKEHKRGKINDEWNFWFHGAECQFKNQKTNQVIELIIIYESEFGALDSYFFLNYLKTTKRFTALGNYFSGNTHSITKILNLLEDEGKLIRIDDFVQSGIIAK